jgi:hypothetical protein
MLKMVAVVLRFAYRVVWVAGVGFEGRTVWRLVRDRVEKCRFQITLVLSQVLKVLAGEE